MEKKMIHTGEAPAPIGPYNQAVQFGDLLFVSGQIPLDPKTGDIVNESVAAETTMVMKNISAVLKAAGMDFSHVLKSSIFLTDMRTFAEVNEVYGRYFNEATAPARETVQVAGLPKGVRVEISVIAAQTR